MRGRPRTFNKEQTLGTIQREFWAGGYAATSLDDLSKATGLTRPSLYAAYGSKIDMYLASLASFGRLMEDRSVPRLFDDVCLEQALLGFYRAVLDIYFGSGDDALGCFVFATAVSDVNADPRIRQAVQIFLKKVDGAMEEAIIRRVSAKDENKITLPHLAQIAAGGLINLAVRARAGTSREDLDHLASAHAASVATISR